MLDTTPDRLNFAEILQALPMGVLVIKAAAPDFPVVSMNDAYRGLSGYSSGRLSGNALPAGPAAAGGFGDAGSVPAGTTFRDVMQSASTDPDQLVQSVVAVLTTGRTVTIDQGKASFTHRPIFLDDGSISHIVQYLQPHTAGLHDLQVPQSPQAANAEQALLRAFHPAATGLAVFDLSGRLVDCNAAFAAALGQTREELQQRDAATLVHSSCLEPRQQFLRRLIAGEIPAFTHELRYLRGDGSDVWACDSVSTLTDAEGHPQRVVVISEDITRQKRAEKTITQNEVLVTMGRLSASIAHELNNPLESVTNLLYLISNTSELEDVKYYSSLAEQELARVTKIATQTLRFYRPQSAPAPVDLTEVVESVLALFEGRIRREQVAIVKKYRPGTPALLAYNSELRQVFLNLVGNSLDAMSERGCLRISVRASRDWTGSHRTGIRVTICDAGSGIPKAMLQKVFEPFVSTKEQSGTGLGLWISRDIIRRHGGVLHVRSATDGPRHGTCMSVFLPAATQLAGAHAA